MHRLVLNAEPGTLIDHKDGDGLNNCKSNLRWATCGQNLQNAFKRANCSSKYKGVRWNASANKWDARIQIDNSPIYLGLFSDEIEAAKAYNDAAIRYFGEFARANSTP